MNCCRWEESGLRSPETGFAVLLEEAGKSYLVVGGFAECSLATLEGEEEEEITFRWTSAGDIWLCTNGDGALGTDTAGVDRGFWAVVEDTPSGYRTEFGWDAFEKVILGLSVLLVVLLVPKDVMASNGTVACGEAEIGNAPAAPPFA